jgi:hypothetical protein
MNNAGRTPVTADSEVMVTTKGNMGQIRNPHPGEILKEEFLNDIGMSQSQLAHAIGVPGNRIHAIVNGICRPRNSTAGANVGAQGPRSHGSRATPIASICT